MSMILLLNKPFDVLCQFTDIDHRRTLADFVDIPGVYPAGRLDRDSEGLVILTDDGGLQHRISHPRHKLAKTYWVQVEGEPDRHALDQLSRGVPLKDGMTAPAQARLIAEPDIWSRTPPVRDRASIPTRWIELTLYEGRNRQVRRMTAAVGHPTLRLLRMRIGSWSLDDLAPGQWRETQIPDEWRKIPHHEQETQARRHRPHHTPGHKASRYKGKPTPGRSGKNRRPARD
ncbi:MAG TPA: pseudouridine synthase [Gammaproteobacteria bacterium]|nr:pseudouridine synthase [Gammaproteobacteria bacterium]